MSLFFTFIIKAGLILVTTIALVLLVKCDNIKELTLRVSFKDGIEFKSLFYNKYKCRKKGKIRLIGGEKHHPS